MLDSCVEQLTELEKIETLTKQLLEPPFAGASQCGAFFD